MKKGFTYILLVILTATSCKRDLSSEDLLSNTVEPVFEIEIPEGFPPIDYPDDNYPTASRIELGKLLFHDVRLSRDGSFSCASCHIQDQGFADQNPISIGIDGLEGIRNSPTLSNLAWYPSLFMDGGVPTLELQVLAPIEAEFEMDHNIVLASEELQADPYLNSLAKRAYQRELDPYVVTRSISAYERTLISGNSRFDQYMQGITNALTDQELEGMDLFFSQETMCSQCHVTPLFTDFSFQNIGLYEEYEDNGRQRVTTLPEDNGKFKVPSLRNISMTAPYMHDGSVSTLEEVVDFFNEGGLNHENKDERIQPLNLSTDQKQALVAFLHTLTDQEFLNNPEFR